MRIRDLRFVTQGAVILLTGIAIVRGASVLGYALADLNSAGDARYAAMSSYFGSPGVASQARMGGYRGDARPAERELAAQRVNELGDILQVAPTESAFWLSLARMRKFAGDRPERIVAALSMSSITGPNEGPVMSARAPFELSIWEMLPVDAKMAAASDLAVVGASIPPITMRILSADLLQKPESVRQDMKAVLTRTYGVKSELIQALGL